MNSKEHLKQIIAVASGKKKAQLCITNAQILDVFNKDWFESDLLIHEGKICGYAPVGEGKAQKIVDAMGKYLVPGFIA